MNSAKHIDEASAVEVQQYRLGEYAAIRSPQFGRPQIEYLCVVASLSHRFDEFDIESSPVTMIHFGVGFGRIVSPNASKRHFR